MKGDLNSNEQRMGRATLETVHYALFLLATFMFVAILWSIIVLFLPQRHVPLALFIGLMLVSAGTLYMTNKQFSRDTLIVNVLINLAFSYGVHYSFMWALGDKPGWVPVVVATLCWLAAQRAKAFVADCLQTWNNTYPDNH